MKHTYKMLSTPFVAYNEPPKVLKPSKQPLDFPAPAISAQTAPVLSFVLAITAVWSYEFDSVLSQFHIQLVGIVSIVADQILGSFRDDHLDQRVVDELDLVR